MNTFQQIRTPDFISGFLGKIKCKEIRGDV